LNPRLTGGKIPIQTGNDRHPIMLVDLPDRGLFDSLFKHLRPEGKERYWDILTERLSGKTLTEVASARGVTKERVRQIEAKILRVLSIHYREVIASEIVTLETIQPLRHDR
jgi:hypothetical protein